jgi:hypothetical protein
MNNVYSSNVNTFLAPFIGFGTATSTSTPFSFGSQSTAGTSIFSQPTAATPFGSRPLTTTTSIFGAPNPTTSAAPTITNPFGAPASTATPVFGAVTNTPVFGTATSTPAFTGFGSAAPALTTTNIFGTPVASVANTTPAFSGFGTQTAGLTSSPFSFNTTSTAPTLFGAAAPVASTSSIFNPQPFTGFGMTQTQPNVAGLTSQPFNFSSPFGSSSITANTNSAATNLTSTQFQQQNAQPSISLVQQRFLTASLIDPFASRGKKEFNDIDRIKPSTGFIVASSSSTSTTTTTTATSSTSSPIVLPLQSNARKASSARPLVDIRFRLKAVTSSPTSNVITDDIKSPSQPPTTPIGTIKSPLTADFSEEEESALIGKNKLSKLRLSNDLRDSSLQSESIRSLYPMRRLAELEALANTGNHTHAISSVQTISSSSLSLGSTTTIDTASAYVTSTAVNDENTLHPSSKSTHMKID